MRKLLICTLFCFFLLPAVAFGSPQQPPHPDADSIIGSTDPDLIPLQRGCCSWHGGIAGCDGSTGRVICNDGTYSPSCRC